MKTIFKTLGVLLLVSVMLASCNASASGDNFSFSARVMSNELKSGMPFKIEITTENISGEDYLYRGSSRIVGALPYLVGEVDGEKITVLPTAVPITNDYRETAIKAGEKIVFTWEFGEYEVVPSGEYDLHLEFEGEKQVIEDFIRVR